MPEDEKQRKKKKKRKEEATMADTRHARTHA
eukprot:COSAG03_NODE_19291_length_339_cov_1.004167_1_plen_30_part_10